MFSLPMSRISLSTLFPYTTLFRSDMADAIALESITLRRGQRTLLDELSWRVPVGSCCAVLGPNGAGKSTLLDRKSTRLNSSHPSTSYAVFCLKKKYK